MAPRIISGFLLFVVATSVVACSNSATLPPQQPAASAQPTATPKPDASEESSFRADLFANCLRAASGFRGTKKETVDPLLSELKFLQLQKLSKSEKTVAKVFTAVADYQVRLVKLNELKNASDEYISVALPAAAKMGQEFKDLYAEASSMRSEGNVFVGSRYRLTQDYENVVEPTLATLEVKVSQGNAGGEYIPFEANKQSFTAAAEAALQTAAGMINNGGNVKPRN